MECDVTSDDRCLYRNLSQGNCSSDSSGLMKEAEHLSVDLRVRGASDECKWRNKEDDSIGLWRWGVENTHYEY